MTRTKNLIGIVFNKLTVVGYSHSTKNGSYWICECECGNKIVVLGKNLNASQVKSCGCIRRMNIMGHVFGRLTVLKFDRYVNKRSCWLCKCECGNIISVIGSSLVNNSTRSCGCGKKGPNSFNAKNLVGKKFGRLEVIRYLHSESKKGMIWECRCECGNIVAVSGNAMKTKSITSCGCSRRKNLIGQRFGKLTVIRYFKTINRNSYWECRCECGTKTVVQTSNLQNKTTKSCGCFRDYYRKKTCNEKYGVDYGPQNFKIMQKIARSSNNSYIIRHWKTGEELICVASYERKTVDYLNKNKINFRWQSKTFKMPDGRTFRPDLYIYATKKWIEIKGYFRGDAKEKWEWFHKIKPNSELWDKKKLKLLGILK